MMHGNVSRGRLYDSVSWALLKCYVLSRCMAACKVIYRYYPPPVGEAGYIIERLYVRTCVYLYVTNLQRCGGIRVVQALLFR